MSSLKHEVLQKLKSAAKQSKTRKLSEQIKQVLERLYARSDFEKRRSLAYSERFFRLRDLRLLLAELGNPEKRFPCIHVAGTCGKGSTVYYLGALLRQQKKADGSMLRTAEYYSPHIIDERERFMLSGMPVSWEELVPVLEEVLDTAQSLEHRLASDFDYGHTLKQALALERYRPASQASPAKVLKETAAIHTPAKNKSENKSMAGMAGMADDVVENNDPWHDDAVFAPTVFDLLTASACLLFSRSQVDVAIFETGLGGRLDSTNILNPLISVLTLIDFDHEWRLGNNLKAITFEKAGIIKQGRPMVFHAFRRQLKNKNGAKLIGNRAGKPSKTPWASKVAAEEGPEIDDLREKGELAQHEVEAVILKEAKKRNAAFLAVDSRFNDIKKLGLGLGGQGDGPGQYIPRFLQENFILARAALGQLGYSFTIKQQQSVLMDSFLQKSSKAAADEISKNNKGKTGLKNHAFLSGRFERRANWLLDGAHNKQSFISLITEVQQAPCFKRYKHITLVFYAFFDKDVEAMMLALPSNWHVIFLKLELPFVPHTSMLSVLERAKSIRHSRGASFGEITMLRELKSQTKPGTLFVACGSFKAVRAALVYLDE